MVMEGDLSWGGELTIQCTDDVLSNWAPESCVILLTSVTPINSIKSRKRDQNNLTWLSHVLNPVAPIN